MLKIVDLHAGYEDLEVLKGVSLELKPHSISILMGPNGAGKSTLLKSVFHLTSLTSGQIFLEDKDITQLAVHELLKLGVAFVPQGKVNFSTLRVIDNLLLGAHMERDKKEVSKRLEDVFKTFPILREKKDQYAFSLSGGQQQMLAIGRALMSAPSLLLMDEPSLGLAPKIVREVFELIRHIRDTFGVTILVVEHNLKSLMDIADEGFVMVQGEIVAHDSCANLKQSPIMKKVFVGTFE